MLADEAQSTAVLGATLARDSEKSNADPDRTILPQTVRCRLAMCDPWTRVAGRVHRSWLGRTTVSVVRRTSSSAGTAQGRSQPKPELFRWRSRWHFCLYRWLYRKRRSVRRDLGWDRRQALEWKKSSSGVIAPHHATRASDLLGSCNI